MLCLRNIIEIKHTTSHNALKIRLHCFICIYYSLSTPCADKKIQSSLPCLPTFFLLAKYLLTFSLNFLVVCYFLRLFSFFFFVFFYEYKAVTQSCIPIFLLFLDNLIKI